MSIAVAYLLTEKLLAFAVLLQSLEMLRIAGISITGLVWSRENVSSPNPSTMGRVLVAAIAHPVIFRLLLVIQLFAAAAVLLGPPLSVLTPSALISMFVVSFAVSIRWRGAFNGGADSMTLILLLATAIGELSGRETLLARGALWYIALQLVLSYFLSGVAKLRLREWRTGEAAADFLRIEKYGAPPALKSWAEVPGIAGLVAWGTLVFECAFPLALISPRWAVGFMAAGFAFHLFNFWVIGLNRFVWIWAAAYPALYFCSQ